MRLRVMELVSRLALAVLMLAILYLLISGNFLSHSLFVIAGQLLAITLSVWARISFQKKQFSVHAEPHEGPLVVTGPYKVIRHPMYAAALLLVWSSILGHLSLITVIVGCIMTSAVAIRVIQEEQALRAHYPDYGVYAHKTRRFIPFVF